MPFYVSTEDAPAKQRILVAALELFVRDGLCGTSVRAIADASGFTNPALFKHFATKDELALYLFERCYLELFRLVASAVNADQPFSAIHRAVIEAYLKALDRDSNSVLYVQESLRYFWPKLPAHVRKHSILGEIRTLLEAGRSQGAVTRAVDIQLLVTAWVGTLQQFARARYFGEFRQSGAAVLGDALEGLLVKMISA